MSVKLVPGLRKTVRSLAGKTIASVDLNPFDRNQEGSRCYDHAATNPTIRFTDGSYLTFVVQETEVGEYGVHPLLFTRKHKTGRKGARGETKT